MGQWEEAGSGGIIAEVEEEAGVLVVVAAGVVAEVDEVAGVQGKFEGDKDLALKEEEKKKW